MDYERIHKAEAGLISPSKLRMKLLGSHNARRKEGGSNSSRQSPSKLEDMKNAKNSLLSDDLDDEGTSSLQAVENSGQVNQSHTSTNDSSSKEKSDTNRIKTQNLSRVASYHIQPSGNLSTIHPIMRAQDEDGNGYDSGHDNGSVSSFEFHRGERTSQHTMVGPFSRNVPSKWNDAEKWIVSRQNMHQHFMKKASHNQGNRLMVSNLVRITPESVILDQKLSDFQARMDSANTRSQNVVEKFSFVPRCSQPNTMPSNETCVQPMVQEEHDHQKVSGSKVNIAETTDIPTVESVSMRDVGTEMTPIPSQEPSRTGTPMGSTTPTRSPISSLPSTPKRGAPSPSHVTTFDDETESRRKSCKTELSERELRLKTRREIAALGRQLGKMNIASWASKDDAEAASPSRLHVDELVKREYEARAAAWEEAEKSKHIARYRHEEIKIQAWESHQKAKFEAQMKEVEAQVEQRVARAREKMAEKLVETKQEAEERHAIADARRSRQAARTAQQAEQIRQTGRVPLSPFRCCIWFL